MGPGNLPDRCVTEWELQKVILERFREHIQAWHGERPELEPEHRRAAAHAHAERTAKLIAFWIFKTLTYWLSSREPEEALTKRYVENEYDDITYYPAKLSHRKKLPKCPQDKPRDWYLKRAHDLWQLMLTEHAFPLLHGAYLKWAQVRVADFSGFSALRRGAGLDRL